MTSDTPVPSDNNNSDNYVPLTITRVRGVNSVSDSERKGRKNKKVTVREVRVIPASEAIRLPWPLEARNLQPRTDEAEAAVAIVAPALLEVEEAPTITVEAEETTAHTEDVENIVEAAELAVVINLEDEQPEKRTPLNLEELWGSDTEFENIEDTAVINLDPEDTVSTIEDVEKLIEDAGGVALMDLDVEQPKEPSINLETLWGSDTEFDSVWENYLTSLNKKKKRPRWYQQKNRIQWDQPQPQQQKKQIQSGVRERRIQRAKQKQQEWLQRRREEARQKRLKEATRKREEFRARHRCREFRAQARPSSTSDASDDSNRGTSDFFEVSSSSESSTSHGDVAIDEMFNRPSTSRGTAVIDQLDQPSTSHGELSIRECVGAEHLRTIVASLSDEEIALNMQFDTGLVQLTPTDLAILHQELDDDDDADE